MKTVTLEVASRAEVTRRALDAFRDKRQGAPRVAREVKGVHNDVHRLLDAGVLEKTETNRAAFPFDAIRVEFTLRAA